MNIKLWGRFSCYTPKTEDVAHLLAEGVIFSCNEAGEDFYDLQGGFSTKSVLASIDDDGLILGAGYSPNGMHPFHNTRLVELSGSDLPSTLQEIVGKVVDFENNDLLPRQVDPVPYSVTPAQAKLALYDRGLLDRVESIVACSEYRPIQIYFDNASVWERGNAYIIYLGYELGLTDEDMDALFIAAARK